VPGVRNGAVYAALVDEAHELLRSKP
jgi:hypothetical protein